MVCLLDLGVRNERRERQTLRSSVPGGWSDG
jgi:hypothetical protein